MFRRHGPYTLLCTGMTRDGNFLIENGWGMVSAPPLLISGFTFSSRSSGI